MNGYCGQQCFDWRKNTDVRPSETRAHFEMRLRRRRARARRRAARRSHD